MDFMGSYVLNSYSSCNMVNNKMNDKYKFIDIFQTILMIILILFGLLILYQIIRKIAGGSWETENIIIALLMFNISLTVVLALNQVRTSIGLHYLTNKVNHLVKDFKEHNH